MRSTRTLGPPREDEGRILEPHHHAGYVRVVNASHLVQTLLNLGVGDDAQTRTLRIGRDDARDAVYVLCKQSSADSGK